VKKLSRITEAEAISEFLKGEYHNREYHPDRKRFEDLVFAPDLTSPSENRIRRALLYRRRRFIWQELPPDTAWWRVTLTTDELANVRVFPRGKLKRTAGAELSLADYCTTILNNRHRQNSAEITRIISLAYAYREYMPDTSALLIGRNEEESISVLEGNHRLIAGVMFSPEKILSKFKFIAGFSPNMDNCVWYRNNFINNWRYLTRRLMTVSYREPNLSVPERSRIPDKAAV
jgi:hypothetical protein